METPAAAPTQAGNIKVILVVKQQPLPVITATKRSNRQDDWLTRDSLLDRGIDETTADQLLGNSYLVGHNGEPVVKTSALDELLEMLLREEHRS
jgi:hypothetical protein